MALILSWNAGSPRESDNAIQFPPAHCLKDASFPQGWVFPWVPRLMSEPFRALQSTPFSFFSEGIGTLLELQLSPAQMKCIFSPLQTSVFPSVRWDQRKPSIFFMGLWWELKHGELELGKGSQRSGKPRGGNGRKHKRKSPGLGPLLLDPKD